MSLRLARVDAFVFRAPIDTPVQTSFGVMRDRPAVFVRATDADGAEGWGEVWCNFPTVGAEHRARLIESVFKPLLEARTFESPEVAFRDISARTEVLALQCAEPGPIAQAAAGLDIALWDLRARRMGQPLWRLLGGASPRIPVYASGLNPTSPERLASEKRAQGYRAFKLKVGFGRDRDCGNLQALREVVGDLPLMVDANQAWTPESAPALAEGLAEFRLAWLEEPLRADQPWTEWKALADRCPIGLAAGENIAGQAAFTSAVGSGALGVVQPDLAKWGGFTGSLPVAREVLRCGLRFCPHYLGSGIGLLASAHLLAAAGGDGLLEVDANPNPLRTLTCGPMEQVVDGRVTLRDTPGLGVTPDLAQLKEFSAPHW